MNGNERNEMCEICGKPVPSYNSILISLKKGHKLVCLPCYNKEMSEMMGVEYDHMELHPIILKDADNVEHTFHFITRLHSDNLIIETFELIDNQPSGYEFRIGGPVEEGLFAVFSKLYERMVKALSKKHVYRNTETDSWQISRDDDGKNLVCGQINSDQNSEDSMNTPMMVVDGKEINWKDFGKMLMTFEGFKK